mmetsp:Transcript_4007/g.9509  ORF Transcript_4007/g.9509 Transcript_4007/m.9509 type:complete len:353 (-) Transcript_4007:6407-7465(-)
MLGLDSHPLVLDNVVRFTVTNAHRPPVDQRLECEGDLAPDSDRGDPTVKLLGKEVNATVAVDAADATVELTRLDSVNLQAPHLHASANMAVVVDGVGADTARDIVVRLVRRHKVVGRAAQTAVDIVEDTLIRLAPLNTLRCVHELEALHAVGVAPLLKELLCTAAGASLESTTSVVDERHVLDEEIFVLRHCETQRTFGLVGVQRANSQQAFDCRVLGVPDLEVHFPELLFSIVLSQSSVDMMQVTVALAEDAVDTIVVRVEVVVVLRCGAAGRVARLLERKVHRVDTQTMDAVGVRSVVVELAEVPVHRAHVHHVRGRPSRAPLELKPVTVIGATGSDVVAPKVLGGGGPE